MSLICKIIFLSLFSFGIAQAESVNAWKIPIYVVVCGANEPVIPYAQFVSENIDESLIIGRTWNDKIDFVLNNLSLTDFARAQRFMKALPELMKKTKILKNVSLESKYNFPLYMDKCHDEKVGIINPVPNYIEPSVIINEDLWNKLNEYGKSIIIFEILNHLDTYGTDNGIYSRINDNDDARIIYIKHLLKWVMKPFKVAFEEYSTWKPKPREAIAIPNDINLKNPKAAQANVSADVNFKKIKRGNFNIQKRSNYQSKVIFPIKTTISDDFEIQATPVTQSQWFFVMGSNLSNFKQDQFCIDEFAVIEGTYLCPNNPVESISFEDVEIFINRLNKLDQRFTYSLPTEAQWEFAVRAGTETTFWFGDNNRFIDQYATDLFTYQNSFRTYSVAQKIPNANGMFDIYRVLELTRDTYSDFPDYNMNHVDPLNRTSSITNGFNSRVVRGSPYPDNMINSDSRSYTYITSRNGRTGFRLIRTQR